MINKNLLIYRNKLVIAAQYHHMNKEPIKGMMLDGIVSKLDEMLRSEHLFEAVAKYYKSLKDVAYFLFQEGRPAEARAALAVAKKLQQLSKESMT